MCNHAVRAHDTMSTDRHAGKYAYPLTEPDTFPNGHVSNDNVLRRVSPRSFRIHAVVVIGDKHIRAKQRVVANADRSGAGDPAASSDSNMPSNDQVGVKRAVEVRMVSKKLTPNTDERISANLDIIIAVKNAALPYAVAADRTASINIDILLVEQLPPKMPHSSNRKIQCCDNSVHSSVLKSL